MAAGTALRLLAVALAVALTGCATTDSTPSSRSAPSTTVAPVITEAVSGHVFHGDLERLKFPVSYIVIGDEIHHVAVANTPHLRNQGLREVKDIGTLAGMLFVFDGDVSVAFTMRDTLIPLDLHLLSADGEVLEIISMEPCDGPDCRFQPSVSYRYALETPPGFGLEVGDDVGVRPDAIAFP